MKKAELVLALLLGVSPITTHADLILFEFVGGDVEDPFGNGIWTMQGYILIDEANVVPGVNLMPFFDSWEFSWTNGTDTWASSSLDSILQVEDPISAGPREFTVNADGSVETAFLCSDGCSFQLGHPEFNIGYRNGIGNGIWQASIPVPEAPSEHVFVTGPSAVFTNRGPVPEIVTIEIRPGGESSPINLRSKGMMPVAVLTTSVADGDLSDFDATQVDPATLMFGPAGAAIAHSQGHLSDVDGDGDIDLIVHFRVQETGITCGDTETALTGETFAGNSINGTAAIQTIGCK